MSTYEIDRKEIEGLEPVAVGYKAVKWDTGTQQNFKHGEVGEDLTGKIFKVDGDISACSWGLHFSKDPANVFNFYEPLGYNRYFKVRAYGKVIDHDGTKSVTSILEFIEEYDLMQFIDIIKRFDRSSSNSYGICNGSGISNSSGISNGYGIVDCYGISKCTALKNCIFCAEIEAKQYYAFNKKIKKERFNEIYSKLRSFNWWPNFNNFYDIKGNKEWWAVCFPQLKDVDNDIAWGKMPPEMLEYIKSLPECDEAVFLKVTGK